MFGTDDKILRMLVVLALLMTEVCGVEIAPPRILPPESVSTKQFNLPRQVHIGFGDSPTEIVVMWSTELNDTSVVEHYHGDKSNAKSTEGQTLYFEMNHNGLKFLHRVVLKDLIPGQKYFYAARGKDDRSISEQFSFTIPKAEGVHSYMVYADLGLMSKGLPHVIYEPKQRKYDAVFHVGDIAYDLGTDGGRVGDRFMDRIQMLAARVPYMTIPGDHEMFQISKDHYLHRFSNPGNTWPMRMDKLWYSLDIGKAHFISLSTEVFFMDTKNIYTEIDWLVHDLEKANANRKKIPWIIVFTHRPLYCSTDDKREDCTNVNSRVRKHLEDVFYFYGVDLVLSGHQHLYERTYPVYKGHVLAYNYLDPRGPVHLIVGTMGNPYLTEYGSKPGGAWSSVIMSEKEEEMYGHLNIYNDTHLHWEARLAQDNDVRDAMWIIQRIHGPFNKSSIFIPDPLGNLGQAWQDEQQSGDIINLKFFYMNADDYANRITVLGFTMVILLVGLCFKKKILNSVRICCVKQEKNQNLHV